jgi:predicted esterase
MNRFIFASGITFLLLAPTLIAAQSPPPPAPAGQSQAPANQRFVVAPALRAACDRELQQYCSGVEPGGGRLIQCLDAGQGNLSASCKTFLWQGRGCAPESGRVIQCITPSDTDVAIKRFNRMHYVLFNENTGPDAKLLVFLAGTGGQPPGPIAFLHAAADAGYRVISLDYNDEPAIVQVCPPKPPVCSGDFRRMRIYGDGATISSVVDNTGAESIVNRLVKLLAYLDKQVPEQKWSGYLVNGALNWSRIAVAGQSQGAGMAAYIAKTQTLARAILFSSPWDFVTSPGNGRTLAPWIAMPAKTPPGRWFGGYHEREDETGVHAKSYAVLRIPAENIRVFKQDLPKSQNQGPNPFHGQGLQNPVYAEERAYFLGHSP